MRFTITFFLFLLTLLPLKAQIDFEVVSRGMGGYINGVKVGDLNGDGRDDLIVGYAGWQPVPYESSYEVYYQDSTGQLGVFLPIGFYRFRPPGDSGGVRTFLLEDINQDGQTDLVGFLGDKISILYQSLQGSFDSLEIVDIEGQSGNNMISGDFNNDSLIDFAIAFQTPSYLRIYFQQDTGWVDTTYDLVWGRNHRMAVGDLTGDGLDDLLYGGDAQPNSTLLIYPQLDSGGLGSPISPLVLPEEMDDLILLDVNDDEFLDLVISYDDYTGSGIEVLIYLQDTATHTLQSPPQRLTTPFRAGDGRLAVADLNCDGTEELLLNQETYGLSVYRKDSTNEYGPYEHFSVDLHTRPKKHLGIGDLNGDGRIDMAGIHYYDQEQLEILYNRTAPPAFSHIDTLLRYDTLTVEPVWVGYRYKDTTVISTMDDSMYVRVDSFLRQDQYRMDSLQTDTILVRQGEMCGGPFQDTVVRSSMTLLNATLLVTGTPDRLESWWITLPLTSVPQLAEANPLRLYPNPTEGRLHLEWQGDWIPGQRKVSLHDSWGRELWQDQWQGERLTLDLTTYPAGIYLLRIEGQDWVETRRVWRR